MLDDYYLILAGGVGAAKLIEGIVNCVDQQLLKIIINTGDDIELFGLKMCPDLDIITYTLAEVVDKNKGWGFQGDTFNCLSVLKKYYDTGWFNAGDKDLATHIYRTDLFKKGLSKAQITDLICNNLGITAELIPMCNEPVETYIKTQNDWVHFEEYFIKYQCEPEVLDIEFRGIDEAKPLEQTLKYIKNAKKIILCPSNPIVSIGTILGIKGVRKALSKVKDRVYGISPIIEGLTVKGPADKLMKCLGLEVSCVGVAQFYRDFLGHFIIDNKDSKLKPKVEELGINCYCYDILMINLEKKVNLAQFLLNLN
ncbi:MAG: 2-phospho-L-lactate transferase [Candidatus Hermodarchaeota archaeon]